MVELFLQTPESGALTPESGVLTPDYVAYAAFRLMLTLISSCALPQL